MREKFIVRMDGAVFGLRRNADGRIWVAGPKVGMEKMFLCLACFGVGGDAVEEPIVRGHRCVIVSRDTDAVDYEDWNNGLRKCELQGARLEAVTNFRRLTR